MNISASTHSFDDEGALGSLTKQIVGVLGTAIVTGKYQPGKDFPVEADLCEQYGASRTAIREALKILNAKGLITSRPRRGTSVRAMRYWNLLDPDVLRWMLKQNFSIELLIEFTQMRLAIEPAAARAAAESGTKEGHEGIKLALDRMRAAVNGEDDPLAADIAFHLALLNASNNRFFLSMRPMVESALNFSIRLTNRAKGITVGEIKDHAAIANAVIAGKPDAAERASRALLTEALTLIRSEQKSYT
jgi:DNA-binding FadR family transcriptional regulator